MKTFLTCFYLFSFLPVFCQSDFYISDAYKPENLHDYSMLISDSKGNRYFLNMSNGRDENAFTLNSYDKTMQSTGSFSGTLLKGDKELIPFHAEMISDSICLFAKYTDSKTDKTSLYRCVIDLKKQLPLQPQLIHTLKVDNKSVKYDPYYFIFSPDRKLMAIITIPEMSSSTSSDLNVRIYENGFSLKSERTVTMKHGNKYFQLPEFKLSNSGTLIFTADISVEGVKLQTSLKSVDAHNFFRLPIEGTKLQELDFKDLDVFAPQIKFDIIENEKAAFAIAGSPMDKPAEGFLLVGIADIEAGKIDASTIYYPDDHTLEMISDIESKKPYAKMVPRIVFTPRDLKIDTKGNIYVVGEQEVNINNEGDKSLNTFNMIVVKYDVDLSKLYEALIPRGVYASWYDFQYTGVKADLVKDELYIYYGVNHRYLGAKTMRDCDAGNAIINSYVQAKVNTSGEIERTELYNTKDEWFLANMNTFHSYTPGVINVIFDNNKKYPTFKVSGIE